MHRIAVLALIVTACTSPNREHDDPADLCASDPPPVKAVFRVDGDGDPKGWIGWVDSRQIHWIRYENGDPYSVADGALQAKCYPARRTAEACIAPGFDDCVCYLPSGEDTDCDTAHDVLDGYYKADVRSDGADSAY